jgi:hypothetical protein
MLFKDRRTFGKDFVKPETRARVPKPTIKETLQSVKDKRQDPESFKQKEHTESSELTTKIKGLEHGLDEAVKPYRYPKAK